MSLWLFNLYVEYIIWHASLMIHKLKTRLLGEMSIISDKQMTPPLRQKAKRKLKSLEMKVNEECEKAGLKVSIQKVTITASSPNNFMGNMLSLSVISDSLWPHGLQLARLLCPWGFSRQSGLPCLPPGDLPNPGIKPTSLTWQVDSLPTEPPGKPKNTWVGSLSLPQEIFLTQGTRISFITADSLPAELLGNPSWQIDWDKMETVKSLFSWLQNHFGQWLQHWN